MTVRPERVPAEEVRKRMLEAGRELALEAGAALTIENLRIEEVIQRARVPRSSVYRMWPYKDDYVDDLLYYLAGAGSWFTERSGLEPESFAAVNQILADNKHLMATTDGRRALLCEAVRVTVTRTYQALSESTPWRLDMALVATLGSTRGGEARKKIAGVLEGGQSRARDSMVALFGYLASALGLRMRDPARTVEHMQLAGGLLVQSMALRNVQVQAAMGDTAAATHVDGLLNAPVPGPSLDGGTTEWTLAAFAYLALLDAFTELDPAFIPPD